MIFLFKKDSPSQDDNSTSNNLKNTERHQQYKYTKKSSRNIQIKDAIPEEIVTIDAQDESEDDIINDVEMKLMNDYSEDEDFVNSTISKEGSSAKDSEEESLSTRSQIVIVVLVVLGFIPLFGIVIYLVGLFYNVPNTLGWTL